MQTNHRKVIVAIHTNCYFSLELLFEDFNFSNNYITNTIFFSSNNIYLTWQAPTIVGITFISNPYVDHPHLRGEHLIDFCTTYPIKGSPPLT